MRRPVSVWTTLLEEREEEVAVDEGGEDERDARVMLDAQGGRSVTYPTAVGARSKQHTAVAVAALNRRRDRQAVVIGIVMVGDWYTMTAAISVFIWCVACIEKCEVRTCGTAEN